MNGRELSGRCSERPRPHREWRLVNAVRWPSACLALIGVTFASGCQATQDCGLLRVWADVNSLGGPAAFVDQFRSDGFRPAAPETGLPHVTTMDVELGSHDVGSTQYEQFPVFDPVDDVIDDGAIDDGVIDDGAMPVQNMSYISARPERARAEQAARQNQQPVVPAGSWLF